MQPESNKTIGSFWTSGTDVDCPGKYHWCTADLPFRHKQVNWEAGHPREKGGCVYVKTGENSSTYFTADCEDEMQFFCEVCYFSKSLVKLLKKYVGATTKYCSKCSRG